MNNSCRHKNGTGGGWLARCLLLPAIIAGLPVAYPSCAKTSHNRFVADKLSTSTFFGPGLNSSGWIPFELFNSKRIFIPAEVNGVKTQVMLDSGASQSVIDSRFVGTLQIKATGHITGQGAGGNAPVTLLHGVTIKIGGITFQNTDAVGIDLSAVEKQVGHALPVILGGDAFSRCVVDVDFVRRRIAFRDPAKFNPPSDAKTVAVTKAGENFALQARIEGRSASLVFDIGNASALDLNPIFWNSHDFLRSRRVSTTKSGGLGGMHVAKLVDIKNIDIAGSRFIEVPTVLWAEKRESAVDGNVGLPILQRFHLLVDLPHQRVVFEAPIDEKATFATNHTGLTLAPDPGGETVLYVAPGSPADVTGFKVGNLILTIDGMKIADWEKHAAVSNWVDGPIGQRITIGLSQGDARTITFGKYF